ncbi:MAG: aminopeptidase P family protein [Spirochaetales bacterium]|jgi:Xaa-Pro aminopeptidase
MFASAVYKKRREKLAASLRALGAEGQVFLAAHPESPMNYPENCYPFRQDSNWLYFVGLNEPNMAAFIDVADGRAVLFGEECSVDEMIWTGPKPRLADLAALAGIDRSMSLSRAGQFLKGQAREAILFPPFCREEALRRAAGLIDLPVETIRDTPSAELIAAIIALREIKDEEEVAELEKAVAISVQMHKTLLAELRPGWSESEAAALVQHVAMKRGCALSFATIATVSGEVLHNHGRESICRDGDMFLLDAGAEMPSGYAGDLTTSFPVGRKFPPRRAELYTLLLDVFAQSVKRLGPGVPFLDVHKIASLTLAQGLIDLGIMRGNAEEAVMAGAHALFFPHGLGHMIGLDVHDMEGLGEDNVGYFKTKRSSQFGLRSLRLAKRLAPGMVHSVEPGIYFIPGLIDKWQSEGNNKAYIDYDELAKWRDCGGMRIEEDWLVGEKGCRRIGPALDKSLESIENARSGL